MDVCSKYGLFGYVDCMGGSVNTLSIFLDFMGDMWILTEYFECYDGDLWWNDQY